MALGDEGAELFAGISFARLSNVTLGMCRIGDVGLIGLARADWPNLQLLDLGIIFLRQVTTGSVQIRFKLLRILSGHS